MNKHILTLTQQFALSRCVAQRAAKVRNALVIESNTGTYTRSVRHHFVCATHPGSHESPSVLVDHQLSVECVAASALEFSRLDDDRWQRLSSGLVAQLAATFGVSANTQTPSRLKQDRGREAIEECTPSSILKEVLHCRTHCTTLVGRSNRLSTVHSYIPDTHFSGTFQ